MWAPGALGRRGIRTSGADGDSSSSSKRGAMDGDCSQQGGPRSLSLLADRLDWAPCTCSIGPTISLVPPASPAAAGLGGYVDLWMVGTDTLTCEAYLSPRLGVPRLRGRELEAGGSFSLVAKPPVRLPLSGKCPSGKAPPPFSQSVCQSVRVPAELFSGHQTKPHPSSSLSTLLVCSRPLSPLSPPSHPFFLHWDRHSWHSL